MLLRLQYVVHCLQSCSSLGVDAEDLTGLDSADIIPFLTAIISPSEFLLCLPTDSEALVFVVRLDCN